MTSKEEQMIEHKVDEVFGKNMNIVIPYVLMCRNDVEEFIRGCLVRQLAEIGLNSTNKEFCWFDLISTSKNLKSGYYAFTNHQDLYMFVLTKIQLESEAPRVAVDKMNVIIGPYTMKAGRTHYPDLLVSMILEVYPKAVLGNYIVTQQIPFNFRSFFEDKKPPSLEGDRRNQ